MPVLPEDYEDSAKQVNTLPFYVSPCQFREDLFMVIYTGVTVTFVLAHEVKYNFFIMIELLVNIVHGCPTNVATNS